MSRGILPDVAVPAAERRRHLDGVGHQPRRHTLQGKQRRSIIDGDNRKGRGHLVGAGAVGIRVGAQRHRVGAAERELQLRRVARLIVGMVAPCISAVAAATGVYSSAAAAHAAWTVDGKRMVRVVHYLDGDI